MWKSHYFSVSTLKPTWKYPAVFDSYDFFSNKNPLLANFTSIFTNLSKIETRSTDIGFGSDQHAICATTSAYFNIIGHKKGIQDLLIRTTSQIKKMKKVETKGTNSVQKILEAKLIGASLRIPGNCASTDKSWPPRKKRRRNFRFKNRSKLFSVFQLCN